MLIYNDQYQSVLYEIWEIVVLTCQKIDVLGYVGNVNNLDLVIRGKDATALVRYGKSGAHSSSHGHRCKAYYSSSPFDKMSFNPNSVFQLASGAYNKVTAQYTCTKFGTRFTIV